MTPTESPARERLAGGRIACIARSSSWRPAKPCGSSGSWAGNGTPCAPAPRPWLPWTPAACPPWVGTPLPAVPRAPGTTAGPGHAGRTARPVRAARAVPSARAGQVQRGVQARDLLVNAGQVEAGIDAEFLGQHALCVLVHAQGIGLPAAAVQGDHQQPAHPLPQRLVRHHPGQVGHDLLVAAERQQDVRAFLGGQGAQFGQPRPLGLGKGPGHRGERDPAPQPKRGVERGHRPGRVSALAQLARPPQVLLERHGVRLARYQVQHVAGPGRDEDAALPPRGAARLDDAAQPGDIGVDPALGAGRRLMPPDRVDEFAAGDHAVRAHGQDAEDRLLSRLAQAQLLVTFPGHHRAKHADAQH